MKNLLEKIQLNNKLEEQVLNLIEKDNSKIQNLAKRCKESGFSVLKFQNDLTRLAVCLEYTKYTKEKYKELGIKDEIFFDTMKDIAIWCQNNNNKGLKNYLWIENHLKCELFKIGRLQYQLYKCNNITFNYDLLPFDRGEKMIYVHIPQGEKLIYSDCIESLQMSKDFFSKHFPNFEYEYFFCESWLLYGDNFQFMQSGCNILQFQSMFDICISIKEDHQAIERVFGKRHININKYPEKTTLQKSAKEFMKSGGKMGIGIGVINKQYIND